MVIPNPKSHGSAGGAALRPEKPVIERHSDLAEVKMSLDGDWLDRVEDQAEDILHRPPDAQGDFDIVAWFAMEEDEDANCCMTECWYG